MCRGTNAWIFAVLISAALILLPCCGKSNMKGGFESITFTPDARGEPGAVWLELANSDAGNGRFTLKVIGEGMNAYGVGAWLDFDTSACVLKAGYAGDALMAPGYQVIADARPVNTGGIFGFTRSGSADASAEVWKNKPIGLLDFGVKKAGSLKITFNTDHSRVMTHKLEKLEPVKWIGGTVTVK